MQELTQTQLLSIVGGLNLSGAVLASIIRGIDSIFDIGRSLGGAIRRAFDKNICTY